MKPPPFTYAGARSIEHAVELLAGNEDARVLAGGQSLLPLLNLRLAAPEMLVDIGRIAELQNTVVDEGGLTIGAGVIQADAASDPRVRDGWPMLVAAIAQIGHPQIRNRGTVCGSLAHNDPLAELPAVAVALDATLVVRSATGERTIAAAEMFLGPFMTALDDGDLLVAVRFPHPPAAHGWSLREHATRDGDFATAGVAVRLTKGVGSGPVTDARVVLFGLGGSPLRAEVVERALVGADEPSLSPAVLAALAESLDPPDDIHGSAATRRELAAVLVVEAVAEAWGRAR